jgi:hypothetical protein
MLLWNVSPRATGLAAAFTLMAAGAFAQPGESSTSVPPIRALTAEQVQADVALLRRALAVIHPGLDRYVSSATLDDAATWLKSFGGKPATDVELYLDISRFLAAIHCDHTKAELPADLEAWRRKRPSHLPFRFKLFDNRMLVASSDSDQPPLPRGAEILAIDGLAIEVLLRSLGELVAYDGRTAHVVPAKLEADSDLMGADFDHFYALEHGFPASVELTYRRPGATEAVKARYRMQSFEDWQRMPWEASAELDDFYRSVTWRMLDRKTAYLRIDTFVNYRSPVDADSFYAAFFKGIAGSEHLILDLRQNGGGSTDASVGLLRYLLDQPFRLTRSIRLKAVRYGDLPQHIETWGDPQRVFERPLEEFNMLPNGWYEERPEPEDLLLEPAADRFKGRLTVLIGPRNASGATMVLAKLKEARRATFIGESTGGSAEGPTAGQIFFLELPNSHIKVRIPAKLSLTDIRHFEPGYGVAPNVGIAPTLDDWLAHRDPVLEAARVLLSTSKP